MSAEGVSVCVGGESVSGDRLGKVDFVEVIGAKGSIAFGTLSLSGLIACTDTLSAEHMKALGQHCVFLARAAARTVELGLQRDMVEDNIHRASQPPPSMRWWPNQPCRS